jgi:predicted dehydrogenase
VPRRRLEVVGTRATALATDTMGQDPGGALGVDGEPVPFDPDRSPFAAQLDAFAAALTGGAPFPYGPDHDLHTMRLLEPWR